MFAESIKAQLVRGALGSGALSITHKGLGLLLSIVLARKLGAEGYGYYAFAVSLMGLIAVAGQFGLPQFLTREVAVLQSRHHYTTMLAVRKRAFLLALLGSCVSILIALAILILGRSAPAINFATLVIAVALLPLQIFSDVISGLLRGLRKVVHAMWPSLALKPAAILTVVLVVTWKLPSSMSPASVMLVNLTVSGIVLIVLVLMLLRFWPVCERVNDSVISPPAGFGSLVAFSLLVASNVIVQKTDIVMLGFLAAAEDVGVYHVVVQGAMFVSFGFVAVNSVLSPNIARLAAQGDTARMQRLMSVSSLAVSGAALVIFLILLVFGRDILSVVFGEEFRRGYIPLLILGSGQLVNASVGSVGTFLSMTGHERRTVNAILIAAVVNVALNFLLIPTYGIAGAATATMLSTVLWNAIMSIDVYQRLGIVPGPFKSILTKERNH